MHDPNREEADRLIALAQSLAGSRPDLATTACEVEAMMGAALGAATPIEAERAFEQAARRLRAGWLKSVAAETARILRSPTDQEIERLEHSRHDAYGYERDFQPESLEERCEGFFGAPPSGWSAAHVLFSSGQAALATILLQLAEARRVRLKVAHAGAYFETRELVARVCAPVEDPAEADAIIVEPLACNGRFATHDPASIAGRLTSGQTLMLDETLSAPMTRIPDILRVAAAGTTVIRLVSGLKLLQQGLEFANVGIASVFARDAASAAPLADGLKRLRTLTGSGLRFVDALALEAPFFLDRVATKAYADAVFSNNAALAQAVTDTNRLFKPLGEAGFAGAATPYCAFELDEGNSVEALQALAERIEAQAEARGLLIARGGSFGFRGHRYEVIEPETGEPPFMRMALGARDDHSCQGLIVLMAELAGGNRGSTPSI